ncbi:MAG: hypothetical protein ACLQDY_00980 [Streptosporangiaceae bacterium]
MAIDVQESERFRQGGGVPPGQRHDQLMCLADGGKLGTSSMTR